MLEKTLFMIGLFSCLTTMTVAMEIGDLAEQEAMPVTTELSPTSEKVMPTQGRFTYKVEEKKWKKGLKETTTVKIDLVALPNIQPTLSVSIMGPYCLFPRESGPIQLKEETIRNLGLLNTDRENPDLTVKEFFTKLLAHPLGELFTQGAEDGTLSKFFKDLGKIKWSWHSLQHNTLGFDITNTADFFIPPQSCSPFYWVLNDAFRFVNENGWKIIKSEAQENGWTPLPSGGSATLLSTPITSH